MQKGTVEMKYRIRDILEADFGCEERAEGEPLMCLLMLEEEGGTGAREGAVYRAVPDALADELCLEKGQVVTEEELAAMTEGKKPDGWDDLTHRSIYHTGIGPVCMSAAEYREYRERMAQKHSV